MPTGARVLDYGSGDGSFLQYVAEDVRGGVGVDLDEHLVAEANRKNRYAHIRYVCADARCGLPFAGNDFDVITALGVLEHVGPERPYIEEFLRVLRPAGTLVIEVPSKGLFRWLDVGNIKYRFPALHRWFYVYVARQPERYARSFGHGGSLYGQFSRDATQHKHYGLTEIAGLLDPRFEVRRYFKYGIFFELIQFLEIIAAQGARVTDTRMFRTLLNWDCKIRGPLAGANLALCAAPLKVMGREGEAVGASKDLRRA
jgi:SAM-dependent methyltransferase